MNPRNPTSSPQAFTLIELLTVIAIIGILMALLFPAIAAAKNQAKMAKAGSDLSGIVTAVKQYYTEYGRYPDVASSSSTTTTSSSSDDDTKVGDAAANITNAPNNTLFCTLRSLNELANADYAQNPRKISFLEGRRASNGESPKDGFQDDSSKGDSNTRGSYFDPWGSQYCVVWDTSGDNQINISEQYTDFTSPNQPRVSVGGFSMGKDQKLGDNGNKTYKKGDAKSDDIISWQ